MLEEQINTATGEPSQVVIVKRQKRSESIGKLIGALAAAQLEYKPILKSVENVFYTTDKKKAMYADLSAVIAATQPALAKHGLAIVQSPIIDAENKRAGVQSLLAHSSGEWSEVEVLLPATAKTKIYDTTGSGYKWGEKFDAQTCGIAITYSRRYTYQSQAGVAAEEDDDANSIGEASGGSKEAAQAVGEEKLARMKGTARPAAAPSQALGNGIAEALSSHPEEVTGVIKGSKEAFRKDDKEKKRPYRVVDMLDPMDKPYKLYCFHDTKYDETSLFNLLDMAAEGRGQIGRFRVGYEKDFAHIKLPFQIGPVHFDEDGQMMLDAHRS
jgi:hypothetical protein